jgi:hypothetical protein
MIFQLLNNEVLLGDNETPAKLYVQWDNNTVRYITVDENNNVLFYESTKHPQDLTDEERHRVLSYCLSSFDKDEIVNYNDLFLQFEFVEETEQFEEYSLSEEWLNY